MLDRDSGTVLERMAFLTEAEIDAQAAMAALDLGTHTQAACLLEQAIAAYDPRFTRNLVLYQAWLAGARAAAHHLDGAAESINHTLDALTTHVTSRRATTILNEVITTHHLADHRDVPAMADALTRYEALQRA